LSQLIVFFCCDNLVFPRIFFIIMYQLELTSKSYELTLMFHLTPSSTLRKFMSPRAWARTSWNIYFLNYPKCINMFDQMWSCSLAVWALECWEVTLGWWLCSGLALLKWYNNTLPGLSALRYYLRSGPWDFISAGTTPFHSYRVTLCTQWILGYTLQKTFIQFRHHQESTVLCSVYWVLY
jgi:hypothetical protein